MNPEEIEQLLDKSEKSLHLEVLSVPLAGWIASLGSLLATIFLVSFEGVFFSLFLIFISLLASLGHRTQWLEVQNRRAELIWERLRQTYLRRVNAVTAQLTKDIAALYESDPRGETLPLPQAIRLANTHHKQQQRLEIVMARLAELRLISVALAEKTAQLRELGESHGLGEARLQSLREDEAALDAMSGQIKASCGRLEMILIEARKAQQMSQLHREIGALTREKPGPDASSVLAPDSLFDIERQITREVETFLRLERETERHLRDV